MLETNIEFYKKGNLERELEGELFKINNEIIHVTRCTLEGVFIEKMKTQTEKEIFKLANTCILADSNFFNKVEEHYKVKNIKKKIYVKTPERSYEVTMIDNYCTISSN